VIALALLLACSSVESPDRDTLFDLDPPMAAAAGAGIAGGSALIVAIIGAGLTTVSPAFVLLPLVATAGLPVASAFGAIFGATLSDSAINVGLGTGGGVLAGGLVGGAIGLGAGALVDEESAFVGAWLGAMLAGTAGGAVAGALLTRGSE
jgi:hypothetical protein